MPSYGGLLESRGSKLTLLKSTFNAEHFNLRLSYSVFSHFGEIHSYSVWRRLKWQKITKPLILEFNVVQGHRCCYPRKARQQCLHKQQVCLSATVLTLDELITVK